MFWSRSEKRIFVIFFHKINFLQLSKKENLMFSSSHFSFLVFDHVWWRSYENMEILCNLWIHFARQDGQDGKKRENHATKVKKYQNTKIWDERNIRCFYKLVGALLGFHFWDCSSSLSIIFLVERGKIGTAMINHLHRFR